MKEKTVYHIGDDKKTLCGRISENCIGNDKEHWEIQEIVNTNKRFMKLCKICNKIKLKEKDES